MLAPNYTGHRKDTETLLDYLRVFGLLTVTKPRQRLPRVVVEFGVDKGGSLLWLNDTLAPERIIGYDLEIHLAATDRFQGLPIELRQFDQRNKESIKEEAKKLSQENVLVDLFIDDCVHDGEAIERTMQAFWPLLSPGGLYVVEDWQANDTTRDWVARIPDIQMFASPTWYEKRYSMIIFQKWFT